MQYNEQVTISVNNTEYSLRANVDNEILQIAVKELNDRIERYKNRANKDELRAAIMAALSLATEHYYSVQKVKNLESEIELCKESAEKLLKGISKTLEEQ